MSSVLHSLTGLLVTVAIPIVAILGGISYAAYSMYLRHRRQREIFQMHHAERMAAIEKGIELPPLHPEFAQNPYFGGTCPGEPRRWRQGRGVTLLFVGVAVTVALWAQGGNDFWWGLVIIAAGAGRLVSGYLMDSSRGPQPGIPTPPPGGHGGSTPGPR